VLLQEPGRRWWQRRRVLPAHADELQRLRQLEASLTAEEVAHFRWEQLALSHCTALPAAQVGLASIVLLAAQVC
jgi:hypothetical protein